jgi:phage tail sheath protein FI
MARSINSPGVQITETDLSNFQQLEGGTNVFIPGFAPQGPIDEVLLISSVSELEKVYGTPETAAERYFFYSAKEVLNSPSTLLTTRLPYGSGSGIGFDTQYSALLYPVASGANGFTVGNPKHIAFSESVYDDIIQNNFSWESIDNTLTTDFDTTANTIKGGLIVINTAQTTINQGFEGYYVTITDNNEFGPTSDFTAVNTFYSLTSVNSYYSVPNTRLGFSLSGAKLSLGSNSVSETIESIPTYNFGDDYFKDSVIVSVFRVRNSIYEPQILTYNIIESHIGSLDSNKKSVAAIGGIKKSYFIEDVANNNSSNIKILVNPEISRKADWVDPSSINPSKNVRTNTSSKGLFPLGVWSPTYNVQGDKNTGNVIIKLERALTHIESTENINVDVITDAGLSTIFANASGIHYDDTVYEDTSVLSNPNASVIERWRSVFNVFNNFVSNVRKDCVFISDPLRQIFVNGENVKITSLRDSTFSTDIYTPLKNCFGSINSNYAATYANWIKNYDPYTDKFVWLPVSGYAAAIFARTDSVAQPWIAPAGLNRGTINNITDIAFNPNQKQRDFLYTIALNPVVFFSNDGYSIFGQKTLQNKPSAFDRINVRRLFLTLERAVQRTLKYFVFEPNTEFVRTRIRNSITPIFELAKNTEGLYDYLIVCDDRNNTPEVIDKNELAVDIYIKPVKAAEFILVNFIATRTGQDFQELV